jgi:hypothetical protein
MACCLLPSASSSRRKRQPPWDPFALYISKPHSLTGLNFGDGPTAIMLALAVFVLVSYLALARPDIQTPLEVSEAQTRSTPLLPDGLRAGEPEFEME